LSSPSPAADLPAADHPDLDARTVDPAEDDFPTADQPANDVLPAGISSTACVSPIAGVGVGSDPDTDSGPESEAGGQPPTLRRGRSAAVGRQLPVVVPPLIWLAMGWQRRWITDDGLIAARTVRQILAGNGPVFNAGERVEANTSTLWTWLLAGVTWATHASVYSVMIGAGLVLAPLGLLLALLGTRDLHRRTSPGRLYLPAGAAVILALPPFWDFVTSGLEDSLIFYWLGLCWWLLTGLSRDSRRRAAWLVFVAGLGWLVRPDMALGTIMFLAAAWFIVRPGWRRSLALLAGGAVLPLAYQIFRMGYYGLLVPNTALAKEASNTHFLVGWDYLLNFVGPYDLWLPLGLLLVLLPLTIGRRLDRAGWAVCAAAALASVLMAGYVVAIGGDFMHARMLLPPTFTLLLPVMVIPVPRLSETRLSAAKLSTSGLSSVKPTAATVMRTLAPAALCLVVLTAWAFTCGISWRLPQAPGVIPSSGITDERAFWAARTEHRNPDVPQEYELTIFGSATANGSLAWKITQSAASGQPPVLLFVPPGGTKLISVPLNNSDYSVGVPSDILGTLGAVVPLNGLAIDVHGLSYALGSHLQAGTDGRVGHDKYAAPVWIVAEYSTATSVPGISAADIAAARKALGCGGLAELGRATEAPMSWDRFWTNVFGSPSLTSLRVPNDPNQAEAQLCQGS
jgi:arabinofuranosyltransferase